MANPFQENYKTPAQNSKYLKFPDEGSYLVRVLTPKTEVVTYFAEFLKDAEDKIKKFVHEDKGDGTVPPSAKPELGKPPKLSWAVVALDRTDPENEELKIWEIPQKSIQDFLFSIASGKIKTDWSKFDIQITKKGQKLETKYFFQSDDAEDLTKTLQAKVDEELSKINLKALEEGNDPFESSNDEEEAKKKE